MNIAPDFTITDGWQMLDFLIRIPAKLLAWMLQNSTLAQATELGSFNGDGLGGLVFSVFMWWLAYAVLKAATTK